MSYKEMTVYTKKLQDNMYTCECGHRMFIAKNRLFVICNWCGKKVYKNKKDEFMDRLETKLYGRKDIRRVR